jgi:hypothetical protein
MSRSESPKLRILVALGAIGLLMGLCTPRASAQGPFSNANYSGRYACSTMINGPTATTAATAIIKYNPAGNGKYKAMSVGSLIANEAGFAGGNPSKFCSYTLDTAKSSYTLDSNGVGFETLVWNALPSNTDGVCPCSPALLCGGDAFFTMQTSFGIKNDLNVNGFSIRSDHSSSNLLNQGQPGQGFCVK